MLALTWRIPRGFPRIRAHGSKPPVEVEKLCCHIVWSLKVWYRPSGRLAQQRIGPDEQLQP